MSMTRCFCIAAWLFLPTLVHAQPHEDDDARTHFAAARLHYERGAYEEAEREFRAAYDLSHRPALLYNLYLTEERLGEYELAVASLEGYLAEGEPDAELRATLEPRLVNLRERIARRTTSEEAPASETAPEPAPVATTQPGDPVPAIVAFGIGAVGLVGFAIFGGLALAEDGSLGSSCGTSCSDAQLANLSAFTIAADVSWITAAVAGIAGLVLFFTVGADHTVTTSTALVVPWSDGTGGGLAARGSF